MIEAAMFWNEPNNKAHWDFELDPKWELFSQMVKLASHAVRGVNRRLTQVLGGLSPIDPLFLKRLEAHHVLQDFDVVAVHGFPLDWNQWKLDEWPRKLGEIQAMVSQPVWVTEAGASSFGSEEVQQLGLQRTAELLEGRTARLHWSSLYDLPAAWHRQPEGSSYERSFSMGLLREDGTPKRAVSDFAALTPELGICQWFQFEDPRLDEAVKWLRRLGVKHLRTGLSWADSFRPNAEAWFDRQMRAVEEFDTTVTFSFTPPHEGVRPHHASPPRHLERFADFCARMVKRYANGSA